LNDSQLIILLGSKIHQGSFLHLQIIGSLVILSESKLVWELDLGVMKVLFTLGVGYVELGMSTCLMHLPAISHVFDFLIMAS